MNLDKFRAWLIRNGAQILDPTNEYELLRFQSRQGIGIIYRNKHGMVSHISKVAKTLLDSCEAGRDVPCSPEKPSRRSMSREMLEIVSSRDGWHCFYCAELLTPETATGEHLCPKAHGGPNHPSNVVLACEPCNQDAGNLPIVHKLALRELKRSKKSHGPRRKVRTTSPEDKLKPLQVQDSS